MDKKELSKIEEKDLTYFGYRIEPYFVTYLTIGGMNDADKSFKLFKFRDTVRWLQVNNYLYQFTDDLKKFGIIVEEKFKKEGVRYVDTLIKKCLKSGIKLRKESIKFGKVTSEQISKEGMAKAISDYVEAVLDYTVLYQITHFEGATMKLAQEVVRKYTKNEEDAQKLLEIISIADPLTEAENEQDDFLRLAMAPINTRENLAEIHAKKYGWLAVRYFIGDCWTKEGVLKRLENIDINHANNELNIRLSHRKEREDLIKETIKDFSDSDKKVVNQIRRIIYLRTQRGDFFHESAAHVRPLLDKIAGELKISYLELINLSMPEILIALEGRLDYMKHIRERMNNFLIYHDQPNKALILEGKEAVDFIESHSFLKKQVLNVPEFTGKIGYKGNIRGVVKILRSNDDINKLKKGEIIVTGMTTANLLPAMEIASAFITDEGGITCHAAIIAREMRKPCIIGTKIATQVLKDGDMIEVDANKGIVRIIK